MIAVLPFAPEHATLLARGDLQPGDVPVTTLAQLGPTWSGVDTASARVLVIAGMAANHTDHATAWASFAGDVADADGPARAVLARAIRRMVRGAPQRRVDMLVRAGATAAERFAFWLGFAREATLRAWLPDGGDVTMFARIRKGD